MGDKSGIQWTSATWNPVRGCRRVSEGCRNCYAETMAARFCGPGQPYEGLAVRSPARWTGTARFIPEKLDQPLRWTKSRRIFVNSMSDLFHEDLTNEQIAAVFGVMAACPQHTFQVLTKRPARMVEWFRWVARFAEEQREIAAAPSFARACMRSAVHHGIGTDRRLESAWKAAREVDPWPLPNVHLGVSVEDQPTADERIPLLLQCPAAVRFVSLEPMLGPVGLETWLDPSGYACCASFDACRESCSIYDWPTDDIGQPVSLDWVIVGGESGPGARPCDVAWIRSVVEQCREAGVPAFVKQLGGHVFAPWKLDWYEGLDGTLTLHSTDRIGVKGRNLANVFRNGTWHTWDSEGIGGENATEANVEEAKSAAVDALVRQHIRPITGWDRHAHMLRSKKGGDIEEWPADLRVRQFPETP